MDSDDNKKQLSRRSLVEWPWAVIASACGLLLLGYAYSLGDAYYRGYLRVFAVQGDAFPMDHPRHLVLAVWGALNATIGFQKWITANAFNLLISGIVLLAYLGLIVLTQKWLSSRALARKMANVPKHVTRRPFLSQFLTYLLIMWVVVVGFFVVFILLPGILSIPSAIGESAAETVATEDRKDFDKGCDRSVTKCYSVTKGDKEIARGYVVAQSSDRIALYYKGVTTQMPLADTVMKTLETTVVTGSTKQ